MQYIIDHVDFEQRVMPMHMLMYIPREFSNRATLALMLRSVFEPETFRCRLPHNFFNSFKAWFSFYFRACRNQAIRSSWLTHNDLVLLTKKLKWHATLLENSAYFSGQLAQEFFKNGQIYSQLTYENDISSRTGAGVRFITW